MPDRWIDPQERGARTTIVVTPVGGAWRERALEAEADNHAVHAELARARELLDLVIGMAARSWQEADAAKKPLEAAPARIKRGRPVLAEEARVFRLLTRKIREYREPTRHDRADVMQEVAAELGVTKKRIQQIVNAAMKARGLAFRK